MSTLAVCAIPVAMEEPTPLSDERVPGRAPGPADGSAGGAAPGPARLTPNSVHFVRTLQQLTVTYSQMADQKASMLMAATFVVFTIAVGQARGGAMPVSLTVLALFAFASALCAILAVLPSLAKPQSGRSNAIFFGVFAREDEDEWIERTLAGLDVDAAFYRVMLRDIHQNGVVLERKKYRWLGRGYRIFLTGLCLTAAVFALELGGVFDRLG